MIPSGICRMSSVHYCQLINKLQTVNRGLNWHIYTRPLLPSESRTYLFCPEHVRFWVPLLTRDPASCRVYRTLLLCEILPTELVYYLSLSPWMTLQKAAPHMVPPHKIKGIIFLKTHHWNNNKLLSRLTFQFLGGPNNELLHKNELKTDHLTT